MSLRMLRAGAVVALVLAACSASDRPSPSSSAPPPPASADALHPVVAHRDERLGVPSFVWIARDAAGARFASAGDAARAALTAVAGAYGLDRASIASLSAPEIHDVGAGPIVARFQQRAHGLEVFRGELAVAMTRAYEPVAASGFVAPRVPAGAAPVDFALSPRAALEAALRAMPAAPGAASLSSLGEDDAYERFAGPGLFQPARVKKVLFPTAGGGVALVPAYYVEIMLASGPARSFVVAASDGSVLFDNDLVRNDVATYRVFATDGTNLPSDGPQGNGYAPHPTGEPDHTKLVFGSSKLVTLQSFPFSRNDPWLPAGATETRGNNVDAYADLQAPDGFSAGDVRAAATSAATFDWTYDTSKSPGDTPANIAASVTQLFYDFNFLHDWYYDAGFDEKSGNHQSNNFGRGGKGNDPLRAEAQDYSGRNNSDAATPADGASPRIQMYLFSGTSDAEVDVTAPAAIAGKKAAGLAAFGKDSFDTTGAVVLGVDGAAPDANDGCEALTNDATGKIVLVHRGQCSFGQKAQNAEAAGAIGVLVANVASSPQPADPPLLGGSGDGVTIGALGLSLADGQAIEGALVQGVTLEMKRSVQIDLDGAHDTAIVAHEWGHVLTNRLVGNGNGLRTNQAGGLGEGWGDFSALMVIARADDVTSPHGADWAGVYPTGSYAESGAGDIYFGTRRVPYSVDFTKDPLTFQHIQNGVPLPSGVPIAFGEDGSFNAEAHNTGEVWASMLWECYVALLRNHEFADAQARMKRYWVAGLKLTPSDPTLLEARDAMLAAALAADAGDYLLFWQAFARRGAGVGATGPAKDSSDNVGVAESKLVGDHLTIDGATLSDDVLSCDHDGLLDPGEKGTITATVRNDGTGTVSGALAVLRTTTSDVALEAAGPVKVPDLAPFQSAKLKIPVAIARAPKVDPIELDLQVVQESLVTGGVAHAMVPTRFDTDEAAASSATDSFDTKKTSWELAGSDLLGHDTTRWERVRDGSNAWWAVGDAAEPADHLLVSPPFHLVGTSFGVSFRHRYWFRSSSRRKIDIDGGVVELSTDGGKTWKDASEFGVVDYTTTIDASRGDNSLKGRKAYGNKSKGYPETWITSRFDVTLPSHPDEVRLRFRAASSTGFLGAAGWEIDDVALSGISDTPFYGFVPHADACDANAPTADAGLPVTVPSLTPVTLHGTGAPDDVALGFAWAQESGPPVGLTGADSPDVSFVAPSTLDPLVLGFALRTNDGKLLSPASRVQVTVTAPPPTMLSAGGGGCAVSTAGSRAPRGALAAALAGLALAVTRWRRRARR